MNDFVFQNTTKVYFGKDQLKSLGAELKKYGQRVLLVYGGGILQGFKPLTPKDVEAIFRMCL